MSSSWSRRPPFPDRHCVCIPGASTSVEEFINHGRLGTVVAQKQKGPGIQSAAGLIRYFDAEEDSAIKIRPSIVVLFAAIIGVGAIVMRIFWKF